MRSTEISLIPGSTSNFESKICPSAPTWFCLFCCSLLLNAIVKIKAKLKLPFGNWKLQVMVMLCLGYLLLPFLLIFAITLVALSKWSWIVAAAVALKTCPAIQSNSGFDISIINIVQNVQFWSIPTAFQTYSLKRLKKSTFFKWIWKNKYWSQQCLSARTLDIPRKIDSLSDWPTYLDC